MAAELDEIIADEIERRGPMTLARFMALALYHPQYGYYRRANDPFGVSGDFFTASQIQPLFGELLSSYARTVPDKSASRQVLDLGAGRGELQQAFGEWNYRGYDWDAAPLPGSFQGLVIANEFFDALPVHLLRRCNDGWNQLRVSWEEGRFVFVNGEPDIAPELQTYADRVRDVIPIGGRLEVNLELRRWVERLGTFQTAGRLLIIDYGYDEPELVRFPEGTLLSYRNHVAGEDVLATPGLRDITSHVNFSDLKTIAHENGYRILVDETLAAWTLRIWDENNLKSRWEKGGERWRLQWKRLVLGMGETFRVVELEKAV